MAPEPDDPPLRILDCVIVGGGAAGLTAATYLGRFLRRFIVIDAGESRMRRIPRARNVPGFTGGIEGELLYVQMREQAATYGTVFFEGEVTEIAQRDGYFEVVADDTIMLTRTILLATGVAVTDPRIEDLPRAIAGGVVRYCPICDGHEAQGRRIAVLGKAAASIHEAVFLRTYAEDVTFLPAEADLWFGDEERSLAAAWNIRIERYAPVHIERYPTGVRMMMADGRELTFDVLYPCLGAEPRSALLTSLGGQVSEGGGAITDCHQQTTVPDVYAAGDVMEGLDQIASACGQGAIAATAIHNRLRNLEISSVRDGAAGED